MHAIFLLQKGILKQDIHNQISSNQFQAVAPKKTVFASLEMCVEIPSQLLELYMSTLE